MVTRTTSASCLTPSASPKSTITIRRAHLWEALACGRLAAATYYESPLIAYLTPYRAEYYSHYERAFIQRSWRRMLDPRNLTFVAVSSSDPAVPVGYAQFVRYGNDTGAQRQIASRRRILLNFLAFMFWIWSLVLPWIIGKDRSVSSDARKKFEAWVARDRDEIFGSDGRGNRWHALSVVVKEGWQQRGIGKMLMSEVIARAEEEGVIVGLESSGPGEKLYRSVGFELLGRFKKEIQSEIGEREDAGGVMIYTPMKLRKEKI